MDVDGGGNGSQLGGGFTSVLDMPETPGRRRVTNVDLREELANATAALKDQKWVKVFAERVARRSLVDGEDNNMGEEKDDAEEEAAVAGGHKRRSNSDVASSQQQLHRRGSASLPATPHPMAESVLVPQSPDDLLMTLDPRFFTKSFDAVPYVLENLPTSRDALDQFLQTEISAVDVAKDVITAQLADDVRVNHSAFIQGMKQVQDVDLDLVRAQIHVKNARRLIVSTKNDLIKSSLEIVKTKRNRDRVASIIDVGSRIVRFFDEEERMNDALQRHAFTTAVDICLRLRSELATTELQGVSILKKLIHRVQHFLPELRSQFDKSLRKVAEAFDPLRYKELLQAYITLADHAETLGFEFSARHLSDVLGSIPEIMVRCIDELSRQYLTELFGNDPRPASPTKHKASAASKTATAANRPTDNNNKHFTRATKATAPKTEHLQRAYERLTELMHTYYLLVQWHRDPFNPSNDELAYLHRCGIDDDDDDDDEDDDEEEEEGGDSHDGAAAVVSPTNSSGGGRRSSFLSPRRRRRSSSVSTTSESQPSSQLQQRSPYSQVLCETGMTLLRYRKIVWETMQQNVVDVLERLDTTHGFKLEHIISLSQTTSAFIDVGEEFTGSPSTKMRSMLRLKCEQYIASLHDDNIELLRMLIDTESWQRILNATTAVSDANGMLRLVEKRSGHRFDGDVGGADSRHVVVGRHAAIHERNVFPSFQTNGNPFAATAAAVADTHRGNQTRTVHKDSKTEPAPAPNDDDDDEWAATTALDDLNKPTTSKEEQGNQTQENEEEFVLTSSSLSGFVRMCGVYLKMMHHLPHISWDIFLRLVNLFEFNLYATFVSFAEPEIVQQLFHAQLPDTGQCQVLRGSIARISKEFHSGEVVLRTVVVPVVAGAATAAAAAASSSGGREVVVLRRVTRLPTAMEQAGEANCYVFAERAVAAASVISQAMLLDAIKPLVRSCVGERYQSLMEEVYERCQQSARQLRSFLYNCLAHSMLCCDPAFSITHMVSHVKWGDVAYLKDRHNDYVVHIVRKCGEVWGSMQIYSDGVVPVAARDDVWAALVQQVMDAMLTSVANVTKCTPQGRALMSMDLLALQNGLDLINHVSRTQVPRGYEFVNTYIKAFFCTSPEELLAWVTRHKASYSKVAIANLLRHGLGSGMPKSQLRELVLQIDSILSQP